LPFVTIGFNKHYSAARQLTLILFVAVPAVQSHETPLKTERLATASSPRETNRASNLLCYSLGGLLSPLSFPMVDILLCYIWCADRRSGTWPLQPLCPQLLPGQFRGLQHGERARAKQEQSWQVPVCVVSFEDIFNSTLSECKKKDFCYTQ
jgi:hypothetical protein